MEDFGPIIWVLATLGALIYSGVSKSKKTAKKGAAIPKGIPGEAWPTTHMPSPKPQTNRRQPATELHDAAHSAHSRSERANEAYPAGRHLPKAPSRVSQRAAKAHRATQFPRIGSNTIETETTDALHRNPSAKEVTAISPEKAPARPQITLNEDFDLRQAIIMSEILHPKFDE